MSDTSRWPGIAPSRGRRLLDLVVSLAALIILSPLMLCLAAAVRLSSRGPVIFRQVRVGQGGVPFQLLKFRTMRMGHAGPDLTLATDPRLTRLGAFMRATSLDELPQFINVLKGEMTLVGPRPETVGLAWRYPPQYASVFRHRPGLTGPVQARLRELDVPYDAIDDVESYYLTHLVPKRAELDLQFLESPTLRRSLGILWETALMLVHSAGGAVSRRRSTVLAEPAAQVERQAQ